MSGYIPARGGNPANTGQFSEPPGTDWGDTALQPAYPQYPQYSYGLQQPAQPEPPPPPTKAQRRRDMAWRVAKTVGRGVLKTAKFAGKAAVALAAATVVGVVWVIRAIWRN